ncbi:4Fe-4S dicluster domain-containing protein [Roseiconus nitratireducens]|uniref:4Fe-4S dicluster domain-containing protein n=1 Tax=Roseiconus nitratireducens TaxID=2605748 RepID=A0A5M6D2V4_9BACT|nr:TAT-variant-translocated molybdopterin oxidoreductase [Roseiconus nitratireducens]KAA5541801.1 4Fe-4S dicluster domain-containing protein [Roseiconus nitratireducens]
MTDSHQLPIVDSASSWWRSLDELAAQPEMRSMLQREFPPEASSFPEGSRRSFLKLMSASLALAGATGCDIRQPQEKIFASWRRGADELAGVPNEYTTAMDFAGSAIGLVVQTRDGRPIKIEGNSLHPTSRGATGVFAQAATLDLYDPDRPRTPTRRGQLVSLGRVRESMASLRTQCDADRGAGLRILVERSTSPTVQRLLDRVTSRWPRARWMVHEPFGQDGLNQAGMLRFRSGDRPLTPVYDFSQASVVVSIDMDFLAARGHPACYIRQFSDARRVVGNQDRDASGMVRLYHLGPTPTLTSSKADHSLAVTRATTTLVLRELARRLGAGPKLPQATLPAEHQDWLQRVTQDLQQAGRDGLVCVGTDQPAETHALAHAINDRLTSTGRGVRWISSVQIHPQQAGSDTDALARLAADLSAGDAQSLLLLGGDPIGNADPELRLSEAIRKAEFSLALADHENETTSVSQWTVPRSHFLEKWSDARGHDGTASIVQPMIRPLYQSLGEIDLLATLVEDAETAYAAVRKTWRERLGDGENDERWRRALADGVIANTEFAAVESDATTNGSVEDAVASASSQDVDSDTTLEVVVRPDPTIWDGRFINNAWLQELPKPLSHVVWDNAAWIAPADARRIGLKSGDMAAMQAGAHTVEIPVWIAPGHAEGSVTVFAGYGKPTAGRVGRDTGFDVRPLTWLKPAARAAIRIQPTGNTHSLVSTQHHFAMEGRHLARSGTLRSLRENPQDPEFAHPPSPLPEASLYPPWPNEGHRWGMSIDLTACVGCSACVIACQAENNIPVVGKQQCDMNREMHWIRVDTYFQGSPEHPEKTLHQPVPCMHCEHAPCEVVCPVAATNHSDEGLNQMIYNRCVGTRYCSNNCPYKVRRFNFLDFAQDFIDQPVMELLSNPEVTIRSRGVMEKCTFCVQRIEQAKIAAQLHDRTLVDGDIRTACQSACPAQAIRFGDLNDPQSKVTAAHEHPLCYGLLEELNTKPRTKYLAEVTNPSTTREAFGDPPASNDRQPGEPDD